MITAESTPGCIVKLAARVTHLVERIPVLSSSDKVLVLRGGRHIKHREDFHTSSEHFPAHSFPPSSAGYFSFAVLSFHSYSICSTVTWGLVAEDNNASSCFGSTVADKLLFKGFREPFGKLMVSFFSGHYTAFIDIAILMLMETLHMGYTTKE